MIAQLNRLFLASLILGSFALPGCTGAGSEFTYKNLPVATSSTTAGEGHTVLYKGSPLVLSG
ncbi:MAG TPA: hypothetical protein VIU63_04505, partial [Nitrospira sp.]